MNADAPRPTPRAGCASDDAEVTAWVVVHGEPGDLRYFVRHPLGDRFAKWSPDHMRAARFFSRESAEIAARWEWEMDARVEEHMWVSRPVPPAPTPSATTEKHSGFRRHKTLPNPNVPGAEDIHAADCWCVPPASAPAATAGTDDETSVICRDCFALVGGVEAGAKVRWVVCESCPAPTPSATTDNGHTFRAGRCVNCGCKVDSSATILDCPPSATTDNPFLHEPRCVWWKDGVATYECRKCRQTYTANDGSSCYSPPASAPAATAGTETCAKCGFAKGHPLHDANRWPGRITTNHPHHGFVARDKMTLDDLSGYRPAAPTGEEAETPLVPGFPRRNQMLHWTTGERAIYDAVQVVEHMGADVRLTDAVILLGKARDRVADFVDGVAPESSAGSGIPDIPELDATDGAHPAWWRGCDHGVEQTCRIIGAILDGDPGPHHFGSKKLTALAARLTAQATALAALREAAQQLAAFARTAPGRLPQRVQDALATVDRAALAPRQTTEGHEHG